MSTPILQPPRSQQELTKNMDSDTRDLGQTLMRAASTGAIKEGAAYQRSDLVTSLKALIGEEAAWESFNAIRSAAESGTPIGDVRISFFGNKRGRRYTFANLGVSVESPHADTGSGARNADEDGPTANDHPEDRAHLAAHIALIQKRRCIAVSMPKLAGRRRGADPSHNENPDIVGVVVARRSAMPSIRSEVPAWLASSTRRETAITIGAEVKPVTTNGNELYWAVVEARHNSRYFDEAWLISQVPSSLHADARDLGEEYNVGILSCIPGMQSDVLWSPLRRTGTRNIGDFFSRFGASDAEQRISELKRCHELATELPHTLRRAALEQLVSNQLSTSLVRRLPYSLQQNLKSQQLGGSAGSDLDAFCQGVVDLFLDAYQHDADEDATISQYWRELQLREALQKLGDLVTPKAINKVRELLEVGAREMSVDRDAIKSEFGD
jgi:hypothetical protein